MELRKSRLMEHENLSAVKTQIPLEEHSGNAPRTVIRASRGWVSVDLKELWASRELLYFFVWRDIKVRYKQTVIGGSWALIQPVMMMMVFSVVFGRLLNAPSNDVPYPLLTFSALLPWQLFAKALAASNSLISNRGLLTKVYFPRLLIPISGVLGGLPDFGIGMVLLAGLMLYYRVTPTAAIAALPLFFLFALVTGVAVALWLAALNVLYRDVQYALPFLTQVWMFATPVAYSSTLIPEKWRIIYGLNPMGGVVEGFRWALLGTSMPSWPLLGISAIVVVLLAVSGLFFFRRVEHVFADVA